MPKLYFRYGTVGSAKTLTMLAVAHTYREQGKSIILMKPEIDTRFGADAIKSRAGLEKNADVIINEQTRIRELDYSNIDCVLVDEAQFLTCSQIDDLRYVVSFLNTPVICYGLRTDFQTHMFDGSKRLFELADEIEEIKATCKYCTHKSVINMRVLNGKPCSSGPVFQLGADDSYFPVCYLCYCLNLGQS